MGTWTTFSWIASFALAAWVYVDAQGRQDQRAGLWAFLAFCFPWIFAPIYVFFLRGAAAGRARAAAADALKAKRKGGATRATPADQEGAIAAMAEEIADAPTPAARADLIRQIGQAWADAVGAEVKAGNLASFRLTVDSAAKATRQGDLARAQEHIDKALSHIRGGGRKHPGGRMILAGLALSMERGNALPAHPPRPRTGELKAAAPKVAPDRKPEVYEPTSATPARPKTAPIPEAPPAPKGSDVPAFLAERAPAPAARADADVAVRAAEPAAAEPTTIHTAETRTFVAPPIARLEAGAAGPFRDEPLPELSARVSALAASWVAEVAEAAHSVQRSYARVKLESAASAVYRGDFRRAIEMADQAAELVPADGEAARTLRAGLRSAVEERAGA